MNEISTFFVSKHLHFGHLRRIERWEICKVRQNEFTDQKWNTRVVSIVIIFAVDIDLVARSNFSLRVCSVILSILIIHVDIFRLFEVNHLMLLIQIPSSNVQEICNS